MVDRRDYKYPDTEAFKFVIDRLNEQGIEIEDIAEIAYNTHKKYNAQINKDYIIKLTNDVLHKREVLNSAMVGLELDRLATEKKLNSPLQEIVEHDIGVFGVDETLALGIASIYGTIGYTAYGNIDVNKPGIIGKLDNDKNHVNTFVDDLVGAVAAAVSAKLAHDEA
ncbi:phosphatidylglycerophosphatase A [Lactobacillus sp. S2-2]|uniref:phosphatidylglycerophosphatase A family protein n=1 Tax=Lactobacillus sp. S2-2 TaxID=2692917 RepID=UPI001F023095|nr:phosphatidylglycerophosphatase A [Lactobacillus sp. S2-2]MCF6514961.1 phosphatidylglycerophosphatase A [Lactobacillus sp. S2-2]